MTRREFALADILAITTTDEAFHAGFYDGPLALLRYMTDNVLPSHPRQVVAVLVCGHALCLQYPVLAEVTVPLELDAAQFPAWLADQEALHGKTLMVEPLPVEEQERFRDVTEVLSRYVRRTENLAKGRPV